MKQINLILMKLYKIQIEINLFHKKDILKFIKKLKTTKFAHYISILYLSHNLTQN